MDYKQVLTGWLMEKNKIRSQSRRTIGLTLTLAFAALVGSALWSPYRQSTAQSTLASIQNETTSFQLVGEEKRGDFLVLKMKNVSEKGITAYSVSSDPYSRGDTDFAISGHVIKPGDVEEIEIPLAELDKKDPSSGKKSRFRIVAVVFDDHTSEGNPGVAAMIRDHRLGKKIQLERINRLILGALNEADAKASATLGSLKSKIASLSEQPDEEQSSYVQSGRHDAKIDVLRLLERLEQNETSKSMSVAGESDASRVLREGLNNLMQESEGWVRRYGPAR